MAGNLGHKSAESVAGGVDSAMDQVMASEIAAQERMVQCREEAAQLAQQGRERARLIGIRTDQRMSSLRKRLDKKLKAKVDDLLLEGQRAAGHQSQTLKREERLAAAVAALAARLTSGAQGAESKSEEGL
ncbi:MAG: hypothetical protein H7832_09675 [Magnetococcus sp. DMHC-6]